MRVTRCGKQLLLDGAHLADVRDDETAKRVAVALNGVWKIRPPKDQSGRAAGGRARIAKLTPEQRSEFARKGAEARWRKA